MRTLFLVLLLFAIGLPAQAGFSLSTPAGDKLEVKVWGESNRGPLFIWLLNQYAETQRYDSLAAALAKQGATILVSTNDPNILKAAGFVLDMNAKPTPVFGAVRRGKPEEEA